jgi:Glycosyltransferase
VKFYIVGSNPHPRIWSLQESDGVRVTGFVEDIRPYYLAADVCVIPLRLARGVQNKVLEAMAMGRPVVTTSMAIQGIEAVTDKQLFVSDSPEEFASRVMDLLKNEKKRRELGRNSRNWVKSNYQWSSSMNMLEELLSI